jgi:hypothetical protein
MDDRRDPVTRLGPDSKGRVPPRPAEARVHTWEWGPDTARRPGLPWIAIFLLVFGGLLLVRQVFPELRSVGSFAVLAAGIAFLIKWAIDRGTASLYAGAIVTAIAAPGVVQAAGIDAEGLTTFSLGVAFLFIAAVRAATGGGVGWQLWLGGLLALLGGVSIVAPTVGALIVPVGLLILGVVLLVRGSGRRVR